MNADIVVAQLGARMHYAVPESFSKTGRLGRFYTDIYAPHSISRFVGSAFGHPIPALVKRLLGRRVRIPRQQILSFPLFGIHYALRRSLARTQSSRTCAHLWAGRNFCLKIIRSGIPESTRVVYGFNTASLELFEHAGRRNIFRVLEQTIAPYRTEQELLREEREFWNVSDPGAVDHYASRLVDREFREWEQADLIVCGSEFVKECIERCGGPSEKCVVLPYGVPIPDRTTNARPRAGRLRVLTVGAVGLRKGSAYTIAAARELGDIAQFRLVGTIDEMCPGLRELPLNVKLTGAVPRAEIWQHFEWADVFLLPSLCEGSATSTYEALAAGLPVICTPNAGSVVRDGIEGHLIPIRNAKAIVEAIRSLHKNPDVAACMSKLASERSRSFDVASYGERLHGCLANFRGKVYREDLCDRGSRKSIV